MKIKILAILGFVVFSFAIVNAQGPNPSPSQIEQFKNTTLLVLVDGRDMAYDALLKQAVKSHWTISEYKFVDSEKFDAEKSNPDFSFLATLQVEFDRDPEGHAYNFVYILLSHPSADIQQMPVLAQVPFLGSNLSSSDQLHKTEMLVKFLQNQSSKVIESNGKKRYMKLNHLNKGINQLESKTLYISQNQIDASLRSEDLLKKAYKNKFQLVSDDKLVEVIKIAKENDVVLHIVSPTEDTISGRCFKMIFEPATGQAYYYKTHTVNERRPPLFLKRDFRKIRWHPFHWL